MILDFIAAHRRTASLSPKNKRQKRRRELRRPSLLPPAATPARPIKTRGPSQKRPLQNSELRQEFPENVMPRAIGFLRFLAGSIALLTASSVMAENAITVYGPTPFDEKLIQVPDQRIVLMPGETSIRKFPTPFKTFHIANPDLINILPLNDTTVLITGKKFGNTDIDILGDKSEPIAKLPVSVVFGPARDIYLRPDTFTIVQF